MQLGALAGAHVIASVELPARGEGLRELGAAEVVVGLEGIERPVDAVLDNVGGPQLVEAWGLLAPGGNLQSVGWTSGQAAVLQPYATVGPAKSLSSFLNVGDAAADLRALVELLAVGRLEVAIGWRGSWEQTADAITALRERQVRGKAILDVRA